MRTSPKSGEQPDGDQPPPTREVNFADPAAIHEATRELVHLAGAELNNRLDPSGTDIWITDRGDEDRMGDPVAKIIVRHAPIGAEAIGNPDLGDAIVFGFGLILYVVKQLRRLGDWRRERRTEMARAAAAAAEAEHAQQPAA